VRAVRGEGVLWEGEGFWEGGRLWERRGVSGRGREFLGGEEGFWEGVKRFVTVYIFEEVRFRRICTCV